MSFCLNTLSQEEQDFIAACALPFTCFDGFVVEDATSYKEIQLLFHFHITKGKRINCNTEHSLFDGEQFWRTGFARFWGDKQALNALAKRFSTTWRNTKPKIDYGELLNGNYCAPIYDVPYLSTLELLELLRNLLPECEPFRQKESRTLDFLRDPGVLNLVNLYLVRGETISPELAEQLLKLAQWQEQSDQTSICGHLLLAVAKDIEALSAEQLAGYSTFNAVIADLHRELDEFSHYTWNIELWLSVLLKHKGRPEFEGLCDKASNKKWRELPGFGDFFYRLLKGEDIVPKLADTQGLSVTHFVHTITMHDAMLYPMFADDPHAKAEQWLNDLINQAKRGFHIDDEGKFIASSRSLFAELNLNEQQSFGQSLFVACRRRMQWAKFYAESSHKRIERGLHKALQELLRKLCVNPALVDEEQLRVFVSEFFAGNCYKRMARSLFKRLPGIIAGRTDDSGIVGSFCVQISDLLKRPGLDYPREDSFLRHLGRQYVGWALDCLNQPLSDIQYYFPDYATTELVAISSRGMPIYQSEYSQYLQGFETCIFDIESTTQLTERYDFDADSQPGVWSKYKHAELVKLIRPALLGCYWSLWHETRHSVYTRFIDDALRKKLPLQKADLITLFSPPGVTICETGKMKNLEAFAQKNGLDSELIQTLRAYQTKDDKVAQRIAVVLGKYAATDAGAVRLELEGKDFFIKKINAFIQQLDMQQPGAQAWAQLFGVASAANATKPNKKVLKELEQALSGIGRDAFSSQLGDWLLTMAADVLAAKEVCDSSTQWIPYGFSDNGRVLLKGLIWASSLAQSQALEQAWAGFAVDIAHNQKSWGHAENVGNAVLWLLGNSENLSSVGILTRVRAKVSSAATKKLIAKQISAAAERFGITPAELEDMAAPDHGLVNGYREGELSGYAYQLGFVEGDSAKLLWINDKGKALKSVPQKAKDEQGDALKALRADLKSMQADLAAQKIRVDRELNAKRSWSPDKFNTYYHEHPLMQLIAHGLIWRFALPQGEVSAFYLNQNWVNAEGEGVDVSAATEVSLWHPLGQNEAEIIAWREFIRREGIKQPLKQAYRELYLLTDAERNTGDHSLRMAGHILKQHQFAALAKLRGWRFAIMTRWNVESRDYAYAAEVDLPEYGLRAKLQVLEPYDADDLSDQGIYTHVITDRVSFFNAGSDVAMNMEDIPARALSEVLRDCDLFVGVASIGNDPNWNPDRHLQGYNAYWSEYSFGELREAAKLRRSVLENILPSLAIADKCRIQERFLHVQGTRGEYKIHIGSTNILMAPDDEYLCIVPERKAQKQSENVMLPFEGDNGFALLLSKAMMLANDDKIKDPTILSQLKGN